MYNRIAWRGVYPGVDAVFYAVGNQLEYDLVIAPGADAGRIRLQWSGAVRAAAGEIQAGPVRQHAPHPTSPTAI